MKKIGLIILGVIIIGIILYVTFVIAVIKMALGLVLIIVAIGILWWLWSKIKDVLD